MSARKTGKHGQSADPFALGKALLAAQAKQLDLARTMLEQSQKAAKWQADALAAGEKLARAQRDWLRLWGW